MRIMLKVWRSRPKDWFKREIWLQQTYNVSSNKSSLFIGPECEQFQESIKLPSINGIRQIPVGRVGGGGGVGEGGGWGGGGCVYEWGVWGGGGVGVGVGGVWGDSGGVGEWGGWGGDGGVGVGGVWGGIGGVGE